MLQLECPYPDYTCMCEKMRVERKEGLCLAGAEGYRALEKCMNACPLSDQWGQYIQLCPLFSVLQFIEDELTM